MCLYFIPTSLFTWKQHFHSRDNETRHLIEHDYDQFTSTALLCIPPTFTASWNQALMTRLLILNLFWWRTDRVIRMPAPSECLLRRPRLARRAVSPRCSTFCWPSCDALICLQESSQNFTTSAEYWADRSILRWPRTHICEINWTCSDICSTRVGRSAGAKQLYVLIMSNRGDSRQRCRLKPGNYIITVVSVPVPTRRYWRTRCAFAVWLFSLCI